MTAYNFEESILLLYNLRPAQLSADLITSINIESRQKTRAMLCLCISFIDEFSTILQIGMRVLQGSVLGLILFFIHINLLNLPCYICICGWYNDRCLRSLQKLSRVVTQMGFCWILIKHVYLVITIIFNTSTVKRS